MDGQRLVLKVLLRTPSSVSGTECDFHKQSTVCTNLLKIAVLLVKYVMHWIVFDLTLCMHRMCLRPHFKLIPDVNLCVICVC